MQCSSCQHENREQALFCEQCGAGLDRPCPHCGKPARPEAQFCDQCGGSLAAAGQEPAGSSPLGTRTEALAGKISSYTPNHLVEKNP